MKHVKKILLLFLPALLSLGGCNDDDTLLDLEGMDEQDIQTLFVSEWKEIERIDPLHPDVVVGARDTTIIFFPNGTFQGSVILLDIRYTFDKEYLRTESANGHIHRFLYAFTKNKLTLDMDSGGIPDMLPSPTIFIYEKIK